MPQRGDVVAAGAVLTRHGGREVLVIHRPKYDDWSFPKGKQDCGEHITTTAVREVAEETGLDVVLGRPLRPQLYAVSGGRAKTVHYWVGRVRGSTDLQGFRANSEVDEVRWVETTAAADLLSYLDDIALVDQLQRDPRRTHSIVVLRHARAKHRSSWAGADPKRPLTEAGRRQAKAVVPLLRAYGVARAVTSTSKRCVQTVRPYARAYDIELERVAGLSEEEVTDRELDRVGAAALSGREGLVICTHRPVLPRLFARLDVVEEPLTPGEVVVCHHRKGRVVATERHLVR